MPRNKRRSADTISHLPYTFAGGTDEPSTGETGALPATVVSWQEPLIPSADLAVATSTHKKKATAAQSLGKPKGRPLSKAAKAQARRPAQIRGAEVRLVRRRGASIYTGDVPIARLDGKLISGEGLLEQHCLQVLDFDTEDMTGLFAQPTELEINVLGDEHTWTPDFKLVLKDGSETLIEVKPLSFFHPDPVKFPGLKEEREAYRHAWEMAAAENGYGFFLATDDKITTEPRFHNAKIMFRAHGANIGSDLVEEAFMALRGLPPTATVSNLASVLPRFPQATLLIACMLDFRGYIRLDREDFFSPNCRFQNHVVTRQQPLGSNPHV